MLLYRCNFYINHAREVLEVLKCGRAKPSLPSYVVRVVLVHGLHVVPRSSHVVSVVNEALNSRGKGVLAESDAIFAGSGVAVVVSDDEIDKHRDSSDKRLVLKPFFGVSEGPSALMAVDLDAMHRVCHVNVM